MKNSGQSNIPGQASKPMHIEFLDSSQFSIHPEDSQGYRRWYVKCQLSPHQAQVVKNASQNYTVMFTNSEEIVFPSAVQFGTYSKVKVVDGVAILTEADIEQEK